jgi:hypothetical protein
LFNRKIVWRSKGGTIWISGNTSATHKGSCSLANSHHENVTLDPNESKRVVLRGNNTTLVDSGKMDLDVT